MPVEKTISKSIQSILLVDNLKGYVVVEAREPQDMFNAIQGVKHVKGQLRGGLQFSEIIQANHLSIDDFSSLLLLLLFLLPLLAFELSVDSLVGSVSKVESVGVMYIFGRQDPWPK